MPRGLGLPLEYRFKFGTLKVPHPLETGLRPDPDHFRSIHDWNEAHAPERNMPKRKRLSLVQELARAGVKRMIGQKGKTYSSIRKKFRRSRSAPPRRRIAKKARTSRSTRSSVPAIVGRNWPAEVIRSKVITERKFALQNFANNLVSGAAFMVGTAVDGQELSIWDQGGTTGAVRVKDTNTKPRNFQFFSDHYDRYRYLKVTHRIEILGDHNEAVFDYQIFHWKNSVNHYDQPVVFTTRVAIGNATPFDGEDAATRIENYRYTKAVNMYKHTGASSQRKHFTVVPYIYRDGCGQRTMGGKFNDDGSGIGSPTAFPIATLGTSPGLSGRDIFWIQATARNRTNAWEPITVKITTTHHLEFYDRKMNQQFQTGGIGPFSVI